MAGKRRREEMGDEPLDLELKLHTNIPWTIKKKLTESDISDHLCRLILPTNQVEKHVFPFFNPQQQDEVLCGTGKGLEVKLKDLDDQGRCHTLIFKRWESSRSYILGLNWIPKFVVNRKLRKGDVIGMLWEKYNRCFCFSVLERSPAADAAQPVIAPIAHPPTMDPSLREFACKHLLLHPPMPEP